MKINIPFETFPKEVEVSKVFAEFEKPLNTGKNYLKAVQNIAPINGLVIDNLETLNIVLDKINEVGLINLKEEELAFLDFYSKLK